jgi:hypothetical protein
MAAPKGNKYAEGNEGGRPPIHTDPLKFSKLVEDYFIWIQGDYETKEIEEDEKDGGTKKVKIQVCTRKPEPPTITGLTLHVGFCNKSSLYDYQDKEEFSNPIKRAITRIEKYHEIQAAYGDKCTGNIFVLKNFGWKDSQSIDHTTKGDKITSITRQIVRTEN